MKLRVVSILLAGSALALATPADLAKAKNCLTCHSVDKKVVGPAYKDVAAKNAGKTDAEDRLTNKILKGGSGVWGTIPMPANRNVTDAEARTLARWVLSQK
jgi:cytochrome c